MRLSALFLLFVHILLVGCRDTDPLPSSETDNASVSTRLNESSLLNREDRFRRYEAKATSLLNDIEQDLAPFLRYNRIAMSRQNDDLMIQVNQQVVYRSDQTNSPKSLQQASRISLSDEDAEVIYDNLVAMIHTSDELRQVTASYEQLLRDEE